MEPAKRLSVLKFTLFIFGLLALTLGCSPSYNKKVDYEPDTNFSNLKTFDWLKPKAGVENPMELDKFTAKKVKKAIVNHLQPKGLSFSENNPDFFIVFYGSTQDKIKVQSWTDPYPTWGYRGWRYGWGHYENISVDHYKEGLLVIDIIAATNDELVWRGSISGRAEERASKIDASINKAVSIILKTFPPSE